MTSRRAAGLLAIAAIAVLGYRSTATSSSTAASPGDMPRGAVLTSVWPPFGQAAFAWGDSQIHAGPNQHPAAIASLAKVMTAYLVLRDHPLRRGEGGPTI